MRETDAEPPIMWREFFESYARPCYFSEPATSAQLAGLEKELNTTLPTELTQLLSETNGVSVFPSFFEDIDNDCNAALSVIWDTDQILEKNLSFRSWEEGLDSAIAPLCNLLFFASEPNGDPLGYIITEGKVTQSEIVVMSHEDYENRRLECNSLREYLTIFMEASQ